MQIQMTHVHILKLIKHFFKMLVDTCPFLGSLIPMFQTSGDIPSGFQSQSGQPNSTIHKAAGSLVTGHSQKSCLQEWHPEAIPPLAASGMEWWNDGIVPVKS